MRQLLQCVSICPWRPTQTIWNLRVVGTYSYILSAENEHQEVVWQCDLLRTVADLFEWFHRVKFKPQVYLAPDGFPNHQKRVRLPVWSCEVYTSWIKKRRGLLSILLDFESVDILKQGGDISTHFRLSSQQHTSPSLVESLTNAWLYTPYYQSSGGGHLINACVNKVSSLRKHS